MSIKAKHTQKSLKDIEKITGTKLTLGNLLWAIRSGEELSQVTFAKKLGVSRQYLCDIEHGRRFVSPKTAEHYAKLLGYSISQFVRLCLQDIVDRDGIKLEVEVKRAA